MPILVQKQELRLQSVQRIISYLEKYEQAVGVIFASQKTQ